MIKGIGHVAYTVKDMKESLHFYCDILGFQHAFEIRDEQNEPWIEYIKIAPGQFIELFYGGKEKAEASHGQVGYAHLCLEVENIHEIAAHLKEKGVKLDVEPTQGVDHNYQCWTRDPDGNPIEFMQMDPSSPHMKL